MSDFLMVVPEGWGELTTEQASTFVDTHTEAQLLDLINSNQLAGVEARLQDDGLIPADSSLLDFRMLRDGANYRIWFLLA